ncbi:MAG: hypothetical protein CSA33_08170 [Desulfobulbus propionicus]|nr:MAG: hypothetical protein CSA33_08170 [Desulfobulbus propionicus]
MKTLKFSLSTTLCILLTLGMVLANLVTLVFWQAMEVRQGVRGGERLVRFAGQMLTSPAPQAARTDPRSLLENSLEAAEADCAMARLDGTFLHSGDQHCLTAMQHYLDQSKAADKGLEVSIHYTHNPFFTFFFPQSYAYLWLPLESEGPNRDGIGAALPLARYWGRLLQQEKLIIFYLLFNALVLSVLVFFRMQRLVMRPLDRLVDLVARHSLLEKDCFLNPNEANEFVRLSNALHGMLDQIQQDHQKLADTVRKLERNNQKLRETRKEMIQTERLAAAGQLTAGLAHEIGNPLGIVLGYIGLLKRDDLAFGEQQEYLDRIEKELERINQLIQQLLCYCRQTPVDEQCTRFNLHRLLDQVLDLVRIKCAPDIVCLTQYKAKGWICCQANEIRQTLLNCLLNAVDSFQGMSGRDDKTILITTRNLSAEGGDWLEVSIQDNGCGIPPEVLAKVREPFFTTKPVGQGTGLGLSVSTAILERAGGRLELESALGQGTTARIRLPLEGESSRAGAEPGGFSPARPADRDGQAAKVVEQHRANKAEKG